MEMTSTKDSLKGPLSPIKTEKFPPEVFCEQLTSTQFIVFNYDDNTGRRDDEESFFNSNILTHPGSMLTKGDSNDSIEQDSDFEDCQDQKNENLENDFQDSDVPQSCVGIKQFAELIVPDFKAKFLKQFSSKIEENEQIFESQQTINIKDSSNQQMVQEKQRQRLMYQKFLENMQQHPYRHYIYNKDFNKIDPFIKYLACVYKGIYYAQNCLQSPQYRFLSYKQLKLPQPLIPQKQMLMLDLDETLVHSVPLRENPQHVAISITNTNICQIGFKMRPYCMQFLRQMKEYYDIYVFTAASYNYASAIIDYLNNDEQLINGFLSRSECLVTKSQLFIKDLRIISNKDLRDIVLVDNLPHSFGLQLNNGIPILEWLDDESDRELLYLKDILIQAITYDDIRTFISQYFNISSILQFSFQALLDLI